MLYLPVSHGNNDNNTSASSSSSSSGGRTGSSSSWSERAQFTHLERMCGDDDDEDDDDDDGEDGDDDIVNGVSSSGCLHFRNFAWLLVGGGLRRLQRGELFSPFQNFNRFEFTCIMNVARIFLQWLNEPLSMTPYLKQLYVRS